MDFTFKGIKEALVEKLKEHSEWKHEILSLGVWSTLLDIVSFIIEKLVYYVDFRYQETTINATLRSSITKIAKQHGYIPPRKSGAVGYVLVGSDETFSTTNLPYTGKTVNILKWKKFRSEDGSKTVYATKDVRFEENIVQKRLSPNSGSQSLNLANGTQTGIAITGHGLKPGDLVYITGTKHFNGLWSLTPNTTTNRIAILKDYISENFTGFEKIYSGFAIVPVREGNPQEFTYIATGVLNERIPIFSDSIDQFELEVFLVNANGDVLKEVEIVEDLFFVNDTEKYTCEIENFPDYKGIWIKFGDGITSRKTIVDERYLIKYAITNGESGNIRAAGIIKEPETPFLNVFNQLEDLYVTNVDPIVGGVDLQTLVQIKKQYTRAYSSSLQLTSRRAWEAAIEEKPYIYKAKVWTELDIGNGNVSLTGTSLQNVHYITAITYEGLALTPAQETDISLTQLIPRKSPTDKISWQKLDKIRIMLDTLAEIENTITFSDMKDKLNKTLKKEIGVLNLDFKQEVYESNVIAIIDNLKEVIRHETEIFYAEEDIEQSAVLKDFIVTKTNVNIPLDERIITLTDSPRIYIRRKINGKWYPPLQISETNGVNMTGINQFNVSGTVVYNGVDTSQITYQCFDLMANTVPFVEIQGTTQNESQVVQMVSLSGIQEGMYVSGMNIVNETIVTSIDTVNSLIILSKPTNNSGAGTGMIRFSWFPDMGGVFGARNPDDSMNLGYILYLVYQTRDGNWNRIGDLRLSKFNQILDYSAELSKFDFVYS